MYVEEGGDGFGGGGGIGERGLSGKVGRAGDVGRCIRGDGGSDCSVGGDVGDVITLCFIGRGEGVMDLRFSGGDVSE